MLRDTHGGAGPGQIFVCDASQRKGLVWLVAAGDFAALLKELLFASALGANTCQVTVPQRPLLCFATRFFGFL